MSENNNQIKVVCVGEAMMELSLGNSDTATVGFAGDTLNTAIYLQRLLGDSAPVSYCTAVGEDELSNKLVNFIEAESIDTQPIQRLGDRTLGLYAISTDDEGERSFTYWRNQSAARKLFQQGENLDFSVLDNFDIVYLSAITLAILPANVRTALLAHINDLRTQNAVRFAFDSNYRPALWESRKIAIESIASAWRITDIALPSIDDETALFEDADEQATLARLQSYGIVQGALKRGALGPYSLAPAEGALNPKSFKALKIDVVDTTAAGDSFNAGYLSAFLKNQTSAQAMLCGHECAARVIGQRGAIIPRSLWN